MKMTFSPSSGWHLSMVLQYNFKAFSNWAWHNWIQSITAGNQTGLGKTRAVVKQQNTKLTCIFVVSLGFGVRMPGFASITYWLCDLGKLWKHCAFTSSFVKWRCGNPRLMDHVRIQWVNVKCLGHHCWGCEPHDHSWLLTLPCLVPHSPYSFRPTANPKPASHLTSQVVLIESMCLVLFPTYPYSSGISVTL